MKIISWKFIETNYGQTENREEEKEKESCYSEEYWRNWCSSWAHTEQTTANGDGTEEKYLQFWGKYEYRIEWMSEQWFNPFALRMAKIP